MKKFLSLLLALCLVCSLAAPALAVAADGARGASFLDSKGHWAEKAIDRWAQAGIINGDGDGTVKPDRKLTRAEFATILTRLLGLSEKAENTFKDLKDTDWYADAILKCAAAGIMQGDELGYCTPTWGITREQTVAMFARAMGIKPDAEPDLSKYVDGDKTQAWARGYMSALSAMGIINGVADGSRIASGDPIDRASVFTLLNKGISHYIEIGRAHV